MLLALASAIILGSESHTKVKVTLRLTVSRSVCLDVEPRAIQLIL
jgi:hypothetical protein